MSDRGASTAANKNVALALAEALKRNGVDLTFGQSLPSAFHLAAPHAGIEQKVYRQENMGGAMADGYARISHKVGVVTAQNGAAASVLVPPLAEAMKASVPIVALVQEVPRNAADKNAFQELDHVALFSGVSKFTRRIDRADRLEDYVDMAFAVAASGRPGPAVLLLPSDLLLENAESLARTRSSNLGTFPLDRTMPAPVRIAEAAQLLANATSPLVIAGGGVHLSDAAEELAAFQEAAHLPVGTTVMGKGSANENHALTLGVLGNMMGTGSRTRDMRPLVDEADVILLVGTRTNENATDAWQLFPKTAMFIHIDADPMEIGRNYDSLRLLGDAKLTLAALRDEMLGLDMIRRQEARPTVEKRIGAAVADWRKLIAGVTSRDGGPVRPERVMAEIDSRMPEDGIMCADASYSSNWISGYMTAKRAGQRFLTPRGLAGIGWGMPLGIGAQIAAPNSRVVALVGDGGFAHSWAEFETLHRMNIPLTVVLLNNGILGYQTHAEDVKYGEHTIACDFDPVDHVAIANACGIKGIRVETGEEMGPALDTAFASNEPFFIEVMTDPDGKPPITFYEGHFEEPF